MFAVVGINLVIGEGMHKLAGSGITLQQAREAFRATQGGAPVGGTRVIDPDEARVVVAAATQSMLDAINTLSLIMAVVPIAAIVVAMVLIKPSHRTSRIGPVKRPTVPTVPMAVPAIVPGSKP